jgi:hypothetical protein
MRSSKIQPEEVKIWDKFKKAYKNKPFPVKRFTPTSLAGRPFDVLDHQNAAFSYPGQGSGADLTVRAIANLPQELADRLALVVHDEIVPIVPEEEATAALVTLARVMNEAGDHYLAPYCECATESELHDFWSK